MKLKSYSEVDRFQTVLMDGQSLLQVPSPLIFLKSPLDRNDAEMLLKNSGALNLLDNLLFNEYIAVDSNLVLVNKKCHQLVEFFDKNFIALTLKDSQRQVIVNRMKQIITSDEEILTSLESVGKEGLYWGIKGADDEKISIYDKLFNLSEAEEQEIIKRVCQTHTGECKNIPEVLARELSDYDLLMRDSNRSFLRAHYYLELARELGIYLSPHPLRSDYYSFLLDKSTERRFQSKRPNRSFLRRLNFLPWFIPQEDDHGSTSNRSSFLEGGVLVGACCSLSA